MNRRVFFKLQKTNMAVESRKEESIEFDIDIVNYTAEDIESYIYEGITKIRKEKGKRPDIRKVFLIIC